MLRCSLLEDSCCLQNQDVFVLPEECPLVLAFLKCTTETRVKIDRSTSGSEQNEYYLVKNLSFELFCLDFAEPR